MIRLRQVALVAGQLESARSQFFKLLGLESDFADVGVGEFGLENSVMALGDTFLEIVAPTQPATTAGRLLERRGGDGGYMVLLQVGSIDEYREHTEALKVRKVWEVDLPEAKAFHIHPRDIGGAIVSLDEMDPAESWKWAGPDWQARKAKYVGCIDGVTVQAEDPSQMASRWGEILKVQPEGSELHLDDSHIFFKEASDGRGDGVSALSFKDCDVTALQKVCAEMNIEWQDGSVHFGGVGLQFKA